MQKQTYPTTLNLPELPPEGRDFHYSDITGEMTEGLKDLIQNNAYRVDIDLRPLGNAYEIAGQIETKMDLVCSRCGRETKYEINDKFRELIMIENERPRGGHSGHVSQNLVNDGPYCNYIPSAYFNLTEFVHEHIAASEPYIVECGLEDCEKEMKKAQLAAQAPESSDLARPNPFEVLKNLKVR